jgi:hypothetical protein
MPGGDRFLVPDVRDQTRLIVSFLGSEAENGRRVGDARVGVYAFFDFDGAAIYVGQTREQLRVRIRRHLTNKRTDAVAMKVLDPMEVAAIEVWPFWDLEARDPSVSKSDWDQQLKRTLDAAERTVFLNLQRTLGSISDLLNEKMPPNSDPIELPMSYRGSIVADESRARLYHPDERLARRASTISALAQIVKERDVSIGLRRTLVTQAERLHRLAVTRYSEIAASLPQEELERETTGSEDEQGGDVSE